MTTLDIIRKTKAAWSVLRDADAETKNRFLTAMADSLVDHTTEIGCGWMRAASPPWRRVSGLR